MDVTLLQSRKSDGKLLQFQKLSIDDESPVAQLLFMPMYEAVTLEDNNERYRYARLDT